MFKTQQKLGQINDMNIQLKMAKFDVHNICLNYNLYKYFYPHPQKNKKTKQTTTQNHGD